nr:CHL1-cysJ [Chenggangzhangella methanolivorans]
MTAQTPILPPLIPENAPFSPEQRAWLNGFFAGILSMDGGPQALSRDAATALLGSPLPGEAQSAPAEEDDGAPWHDASMPIDERMELAKDRPVSRKMFAAMAQQDCGQCGYQCETYSAAIAAGEEKKLNLCVPGGKETQRMLKKLAADLEGGAAAPAAVAPTPAVPAIELGRSREHPVEATFLSRLRLNGDGSDKETNHVEIDLSACGLTYEPGDSFGLFATNCSELAGLVAKRLEVSTDEPVTHDGETMPFGVWLSDKVSLGAAPDALFELMGALASDPDDKTRLARLAEGEDPDGDLMSLDVLAALEKFPAVTPAAAEFLGALDPAAAAAIFDLVRAFRRSRQGEPDGRQRALPHRRAHAQRPRLHLSRRPRRAGLEAQGLCPEGPWLRPAGLGRGPDHHGGAGHRRRAVPLVPAGAPRD